jgi:hypothetical protein
MTSGKALLISELVIRVWRNVIWQALGRSVLLACVSLLLVCACAVAVEVMILEFGGPLISGIQTAFGELGRADLIRLTFDQLAVSAAIFFTVLAGISPNLTILDRNLAALPVRPWERYVGYLLPSVGLIALGLALLFAPIAWLAGSTIETGRPWLLVVFGLQIVYAVLLTTLLQLIVVVILTRLLALSELIARILAAVSVGTLFLIILVSDTATTLRTRATPLSALSALQQTTVVPTFLPHAGLALIGWLFLTAAAVLAVLFLMSLALLGVARLLVRSDAPSVGPLFASVITGRRGFGVLVVTAARLAFRHPENRVSAIMYLGIASLASFLMASQRAVSEWSGLAVLGAVAVGASFGINAYGRTRPMRWVLLVAPVGRRTWLAGNAIGSVVFSGFATLALIAPFFVVGWRPTSAFDVVVLVSIFVLTYAWMHAAGVLVPYSDDVPLSSGLIALAALVVGLPLIYLLWKFGLLDGSVRGLIMILIVVGSAAGVVSWSDRARLAGSGF